MTLRFFTISLVVLFSIFLYGGSIYPGSHPTAVVHITKEGFVPSYIRIPVGGDIDWINKDTNPHWPASDFHPTHGQYPSKEKGCLGSALDACRTLDKGEYYSFIFDEKGEWGIHDHLHPGMTMTVEVVDNMLIASIFSYVESAFSFNTSSRLPSPEEFLNLDFNKQLEIIKKISTKNPREAWIYVKEAYTKEGQVIAASSVDTSFIDYPHILSHIVGNTAYKQYGMEAFSFCDSTFSYGCLHGTAEQSLLEMGVGAIHECIKAGRVFECSHGMGHGLLVWSQYDIYKALKNCDILPEDRLGCYDGVFMEYKWSAPKTELAEDGLFKFCDSFIDSKYFESCVVYQPQIFMSEFGWSFERVVEECINSLNEKIRGMCGNMLGVTTAHIAEGDPRKVEQHCSLLEGIDQSFCMIGAARAILHQRYYNWKDTVPVIMASQEPLKIAFFYNTDEFERASEEKWVIEHTLMSLIYEIVDFRESKRLYKTDTVYLKNKDKKDAALVFARFEDFVFIEHLEEDELSTEADIIAVFAGVHD